MIESLVADNFQFTSPLDTVPFARKGPTGAGKLFTDVAVEEAITSASNDFKEQIKGAKIHSTMIDEKKISAGQLSCEEFQFSVPSSKEFKLLLCAIPTKHNILVMGLSPILMGQEKKAHSFFETMCNDLKYGDHALTRADVKRLSLSMTNTEK